LVSIDTPLLATTQSKLIPSQQSPNSQEGFQGSNYFVTVVVNWPRLGLLNLLKQQQGQVFLTDEKQSTALIGVVNQGGEVPLSYTLKANAGDEIYSYLHAGYRS
jgi:hypothetical protein